MPVSYRLQRGSNLIIEKGVGNYSGLSFEVRGTVTKDLGVAVNASATAIRNLHSGVAFLDNRAQTFEGPTTFGQPLVVVAATAATHAVTLTQAQTYAQSGLGYQLSGLQNTILSNQSRLTTNESSIVILGTNQSGLANTIGNNQSRLTLAEPKITTLQNNQSGISNTLNTTQSRTTVLVGNFSGVNNNLITHTHSFASLTAKPTTLAGYGIVDGGGTIANPNVGYIRSSGNDTTGNGTIGSPYLTAQKAYDMGFSVIDAGIGSFGNINCGPASINLTLIGVGRTQTIFGNIAASSGTIRGNGRNMLTVGTILFQAPAGNSGALGDQYNPAPEGEIGSAATNSFIIGLYAVADWTLQGGNGGTGGQGNVNGSGEFGLNGGAGGLGGNSALLTIVDCETGGTVFSIGGNGGAGGTGGVGWGNTGNNGSTGAGGNSGTISFYRSTANGGNTLGLGGGIDGNFTLEFSNVAALTPATATSVFFSVIGSTTYESVYP